MNRFLMGAAGLLIVLVLIWAYGQYEHSEGYQARDTEALVEQAEAVAAVVNKERLVQEKLERERDDAYEQKQLADAAILRASSDTDRLRRTIATQARMLKNTGPATRTDAVAAACWVALDESIQRYRALAKTADGYVKAIRIGQGWARAISE